MGRAIIDLFKSEQLTFPDGSTNTAQNYYAIRDSKDLKDEPSNKLLLPAFRLRDKIQKLTSRRTKETLFEEETGGIRALMLLSGPVIYGTDIFRLKRRTTDDRDLMVSKSLGGTPGSTRGLLGGVLNFARNAPKKVGKFFGIKFPELMIPSRFIDNSNFKAGSSDLPEQISKILRESQGSGVGRFLQDTIKGTPNQIVNQTLTRGLGEIRNAINQGLFGSRKQGANRLAKKPENRRYFDAYSIYSDVVDENNTDIKLRNDLSNKFYAFREISKVGGIFGPKFFATKTRDKNQNSKIRAYAYQTPYNDGFYNQDWRTTINYIGDKKTPFKNSKKPGIQAIGNQMETGTTARSQYMDLDIPLTNEGLPIPYTERIDLNPTSILDANDLATYLDSYIVSAINSQPYPPSKKGAGYEDRGVPEMVPNGPRAYYSKTDGVPNTNGYDTARSIQYYREIGSNTGDTLNQQGVGASKSFKSVLDGTTKTLDEIDFITLKIGGADASYNLKQAYFRGTVKGLTETFSPSYNQNQGVGMPYPLYTYESIERTVAFSFDVYSQNQLEHIKAWERLEHLGALTAPFGFTSARATVPPIVRFTLGDLFKERVAWIETLSYTTDQNFPWEIGYNSTGSLDMSCYKLPMIINVQITFHFIDEYDSSNSADAMYDFGIAPKRASQIMGTPAGTVNTGLPAPNPTARVKPVLAPITPLATASTLKGITNLGVPANLKPIVLPSNFKPNITPKTSNDIDATPAGGRATDPTGANTDSRAAQGQTNGDINDNKKVKQEKRKELEERAKKAKKGLDADKDSSDKLSPSQGLKIKATGQGSSRDESLARKLAKMDAMRNALRKMVDDAGNVRVSTNILDEKTFLENGIYTVKVDIEIEIL